MKNNIMDKKRAIIITLACIFVLLIIAFLSSFGFYKAEIYPIEIKRFMIRKIKNDNMYMNFLKPKASSILNQGDLVIYKSPVFIDPDFKEKENLCSRIIALPGDIIHIRQTEVYVNDNLVAENYERYFLFRLSMQEETNFKELLDDFKVEITDSLNNNKACEFIATQYIADQIAELSGIVNVRKIVGDTNKGELGIFPGQGYPWNRDNWGPVVVPQQGITVILDRKNILLYKKIIDVYEDNDLYIFGNNIKINNQPATQYTFKKDYYFVLNDNRFNKPDSRTLGFIPENYIIGKVLN